MPDERPVAALRGVSMRYGRVTALHDVDLAIHAGQMLALLGPNGAGKSTSIALLNLVYLPMAFLSGLWFPLSVMPGWLATAAPVWPSYHLNAIAQHVVGLSTAPVMGHVLVLAGVAAGCFSWAAARLRRRG